MVVGGLSQILVVVDGPFYICYTEENIVETLCYVDVDPFISMCVAFSPIAPMCPVETIALLWPW